jgi:protein SDA1
MHHASLIKFYQLLEDHLQKIREEDGAEPGDEDDEAAWDAWDVESDSSEEDSDSEPWINVDSDSDNDLDISDSEDERPSKKEGKARAKLPGDDEPMDTKDTQEPVPDRVSTLATTKVGIYAYNETFSDQTITDLDSC